MVVRLQINITQYGITTKVIPENIANVVLACNNMCLNHFCTSGHAGFLENISIAFIDKTDPSDRLKREDYCGHALKTIAPFGLNIEESV